MKDSAKYVGTPQSIAIRIPDCSVTTHLIDLVSGQSTLVPAAPVTGPCHSTAQEPPWCQSPDLGPLASGRVVRGWSSLSALLTCYLSSLSSFLSEVTGLGSEKC